MIRRVGSIELLGAHGGPRIVRTKESIRKVNNRLRRKKEVSATSVRRILQIDLGLKPYKKVIEPSLTFG